MKQLESLWQTGSVADYQTKFEKLAHSILLYNPSYHDVYFVTRFLGGLKEEIRAPIIMHRPLNLEAAGTLALLWEAKLEMARSKVQSRSDHRDSVWFQSKINNVSDRAKFRMEEVKTIENVQTNGNSDKLSALKAYRRANSLCFTYGEKWTGRNHKCPTQVPTHVIHKLLEVVQVETDLDYSSREEDSELHAGQVIMAIQSPAPGCSTVKSDKKNRTLRLRGIINSQDVLILLDSRSVGSFISQELVAQIAQKPVPL